MISDGGKGVEREIFLVLRNLLLNYVLTRRALRSPQGPETPRNLFREADEVDILGILFVFLKHTGLDN